MCNLRRKTLTRPPELKPNASMFNKPVHFLGCIGYLTQFIQFSTETRTGKFLGHILKYYNHFLIGFNFRRERD